jgi:serine protease Do
MKQKTAFFHKYVIISVLLYYLFGLESCDGCSVSSSRRRSTERQTHNVPTNRRDRTSPNTSNSSTTIPPPTGKNKTIADVISYAERCVFMVFTLDENDNSIGQGSGFFINSNGLAVSNHHVFESGFKWLIKTIDGNTHFVKSVLKNSKEFDHVVFEVEMGNKPFPSLTVATQTPRKGDPVLVLGNPKGLESTLTQGVVSSLREGGNLIQIDAAISPGSSGGPVMTIDGKVIGIATMKIRECENCNFAINIQKIR